MLLVGGGHFHGMAVLADVEGVRGHGAGDQPVARRLDRRDGVAAGPADDAAEHHEHERRRDLRQPVVGVGGDPASDALRPQAFGKGLVGKGRMERGDRLVLALPMGDLGRPVGVGGEIAIHLGPLGLRQLPVGIGEQPILRDVPAPVRVHFTVLSRGGSSLAPVRILRAARARPSRDISVPAGMPMIPAASS